MLKLMTRAQTEINTAAFARSLTCFFFPLEIMARTIEIGARIIGRKKVMKNVVASAAMDSTNDTCARFCDAL